MADLQRVMGDAAPKKLSLLYRGSRDGFNAAAFHAQCDGRGATLTVVRSKKGNVFGGYTSVPWASSSGVWARDASAYIFSLRGPRAPPGAPLRMNHNDSQYAVLHNSSYGPSSHDLRVYNDMQAESGHSSWRPSQYSLVRACMQYPIACPC